MDCHEFGYNQKPLWLKLWWKFVPGVEVLVLWPSGEIVAGPGPSDPNWFDWGGAAYIKYFSADPNAHYRQWLEQNIGKQGWDWDWCEASDEELLRIKIRRKHQRMASWIALQWS